MLFISSVFYEQSNPSQQIASFPKSGM